MRKIITFVAATMAIGTVMAQNRIVDNPDNRIYYGVRASLDLTLPGTVSEVDYMEADKYIYSPFSSNAGFSLGAVCNYPLFKNLYVEPGIELYYNTMKMYDLYEDYIDNEFDFYEADGYGDFANLGGSVRKFGLRIPVVAGYHFDFTRKFSLYVYTGPVFNIGLTCKAYQKWVDDGERGEWTTNLYKNTDDDANPLMFKRFNLDWRCGVGISFGNYYLATVTDFNLLNNATTTRAGKNEYSYTNRNGLFQLTLGYNFR